MGISRKLRRKAQKKAFKVIKRVLDEAENQEGNDMFLPFDMAAEVDDDFYSQLTENFQQNILDSELWPQMVNKYGEEKARELLDECKVNSQGDFADGNLLTPKKE